MTPTRTGVRVAGVLVGALGVLEVGGGRAGSGVWARLRLGRRARLRARLRRVRLRRVGEEGIVVACRGDDRRGKRFRTIGD